jgi:hypothetical protein
MNLFAATLIVKAGRTARLLEKKILLAISVF